MESAITTEISLTLTWNPQQQQQQQQQQQNAPKPELDTSYPRRIFTPATEHAPAGHITDDTARGSLFWEAEAPLPIGAGETSPSSDEGVVAEQVHGKPFRISWQSTQSLPFYRVRYLRNPWNHNREVKIARDGTELEPSVGANLINLFHEPVAQPPPPRGPFPGGYGRPY